jgi:hypothetical protein
MDKELLKPFIEAFNLAHNAVNTLSTVGGLPPRQGEAINPYYLAEVKFKEVTYLMDKIVVDSDMLIAVPSCDWASLSSLKDFLNSCTVKHTVKKWFGFKTVEEYVHSRNQIAIKAYTLLTNLHVCYTEYYTLEPVKKLSSSMDKYRVCIHCGNDGSTIKSCDACVGLGDN